MDHASPYPVDHSTDSGGDGAIESVWAMLLAGCGAVLVGADLGGAVQLVRLGSSDLGYKMLGLIFGASLLAGGIGFGIARFVLKLEGKRVLPPAFIAAGLVGGALPFLFLWARQALRYAMGLGAAAGVGVSVLALSGRAIRDAQRLRVQQRAQNLTEDAWTEHAMGEVEKAEALLVEALSLCEKKLGPRNLFTLVTLHSLANLYRVHQQYDLAEKHYDRALPLYAEIVKNTPSAQPTCVYHVALNRFGQKKFREAIATARQSIEMRADRGVGNPVEEADCYTLMARAEVELGDDEAAIPLFSKALDLQNERLPNNHPLVLGLLGALSGCYMRLNRFHETEGYLEHLVEQIETSEQPDYELMVEALLDLGRVRTVQNKVVEAMPLYRRGLRFLQHQVGPNDRLLQKILEGFQSLLNLQKGEAEGVIDLLVLFRGEREQIRKLLEERPGWADSRDRTGWGPLQWAIFMGREDIASWLLRKGASTEFDSEDALGPLHVAAAWGRRQSLMDLLSAGCEVNARGPAGWTPIFWACHMGRGRIVDLLLKRNVEVNLRDDLGWSPLHVAAAGGHSDCAVALLSANARVNAKEKTKGQTPMHLAALRSHMKMVEVLMLNGGDVTMQDQDGKSSMDVAGERGNRLMVRFMNKFLTGRGKWEGTPNAD